MGFRPVLAGLALLALAQGAAQSAAPVWSTPDRFWYSRAIAGGRVWMTVDAEHGVRAPLFDHQRLAIELNLKADTSYTALALPFADSDVEFTVKHDSKTSLNPAGLAIEFVLNRRVWRCELELKWSWSKEPPTDYECADLRAIAAEPAAAAPRAAAVVSPDGRWEAFIQDHNVAIRPAGRAADPATVLSSDGKAGFAYQGGSIRWSRDSASVSAYRVSDAVWLSDSVAVTSVNALVARGEWRAR